MEKTRKISVSEEESVALWLDTHEEFAKSFIEDWLLSHPQSAKGLYTKYSSYLANPNKTAKRSSSYDATSSRSKDDDDFPILRPRKSSNDVTLQASIAVSRRASDVSSLRHLHEFTPSFPSQRKRKTASELKKLEKNKLFVELLTDVVSPDVDVDHLTHKILVNVLILTKADRSSLFLVEGPDDNQILVSRLFDVTENTTAKDAIHDESETIKMPMGVGIAGMAAKTGETINLKDAYKDPRFNRSVDVATGFQTKSILCMPIKTSDGQVIGVAQVINKDHGSGVFTEEDEEDFRMYLNFCAIGLVNSQLLDQSIALSRRLRTMLHLSRGLFEDTTQLEVVMDKVMQKSMELTPCEFCSVLLLDKDMGQEIKFGQTFQMYDVNNDDDVDSASGQPRAIMSDLTIAEHVAMTAAPVIMSNVVRENVNGRPNLTLAKYTKSVLCVPIINKDGRVLGIVNLSNRLHQACFNQSDLESLADFATFCGLGLHNVMMYEKISIANARNRVALDVLSYHATSCASKANKLMKSPVPPASAYQLPTFKFDDIVLSEDHTVLASVRIFVDSGLVEKFKMDTKVLYRWILSVKKNYRPVTYHNWRHAFNVAQTMFVLFTTGKLQDRLTDLEQLALLIACFCHDLDHRGTNNAYQVMSGSVLAQLYSTSTMEHHHFDHCIMILNSEGNQILERVPPGKYNELIKMLENAILSTDLGLYFKKKKIYEQQVRDNSFDWDNPVSRELFRGMIMTACDVSAIAKPWSIQKRIAAMVTDEFFEQGDMERDSLQMEPIAMMDRRKKDELPKMQVGFIDYICLPLYKILAKLDPHAFNDLLQGVLANRRNWALLADDPTAVIETEEGPTVILPDLESPNASPLHASEIVSPLPVDATAVISNITNPDITSAAAATTTTTTGATATSSTTATGAVAISTTTATGATGTSTTTSVTGPKASISITPNPFIRPESSGEGPIVAWNSTASVNSSGSSGSESKCCGGNKVADESATPESEERRQVSVKCSLS